MNVNKIGVTAPQLSVWLKTLGNGIDVEGVPKQALPLNFDNRPPLYGRLYELASSANRCK